MVKRFPFAHEHIPYADAYCTWSPSGPPPRVMPIAMNNPLANMNYKIGNQTVEELLIRNKSISDNQRNGYPFYDPLDPSTMWSGQNIYCD